MHAAMPVEAAEEDRMERLVGPDVLWTVEHVVGLVRPGLAHMAQGDGGF